MKPFRLLPLFLLLLAAPLLAQNPTPLRLGTWNLEFFGCRKDQLRTDADKQAIADYIRNLHVAVLAVQEVCSDEALVDLTHRIGPDFKFVLGTTGDWNDGKTRQSIGFLYDNAQVELLQAAELLQLPRELDGMPIFHRVPVSACFRSRDGGVDFRAITVHFKAGQKAQDEQKRDAEVTLLRGYVQHLLDDAKEDHDIVVLGDFNHSYDAEPCKLFSEDDTVHYLRPETLAPTIVHFSTPIDMVATTRSFSEALERSYAVHGEQGLLDKDQWAKTYSDHFPVTVDVDRSQDQDPEATFAFPDPRFVLPKELRGEAVAAAVVEVEAARPAAGGEPIPVGSNVEVRMRNGDSWGGTLLQPLGGSWVYVQSGDHVVGVPVEFVAFVSRK